jgi:hypothetical protein
VTVTPGESARRQLESRRRGRAELVGGPVPHCDGIWKTEILPGTTRGVNLRTKDLEVVAVSAVNRVGVMSAPAVSPVKTYLSQQ